MVEVEPLLSLRCCACQSLVCGRRRVSSTVGEDASASSYGRGDLFGAAAESPILRSVDRELCEESGGELMCSEGSRRPGATDPRVMVRAERFLCA
jgi:hypothetical protein